MSSINLSLVSPSAVGNYAGCTMRLVWDSDCPRVDEAKPYADFGTMCHYIAMWKMGLNPPEIENFALVEASARSIYRSTKAFEADLEAATNRAVKELPKLPNGVQWVCEVKDHTPKLLPQRVSRKGKKGFGGTVDLLATDRSQLWDFKFQSRPPEKIKIAYLWQMASYHLITDVPVCGLLFTTRDGVHCRSCQLDFRDPKAAAFAKHVAAFINYTGHDDFRRNAWPTPGEHCEDWCQHKARCFAYQPPVIEDKNLLQAAQQSAVGLASLMELTATARLSTTGKAESLI